MGVWGGLIATPERDISVRLWINADGTTTAQLEDQTPVGVADLRIRNKTLSGRMESDIVTTQALRRPNDLELDITFRDGQLEGTVNAIGRKSSRGLGLPYWVELRKRDDG